MKLLSFVIFAFVSTIILGQQPFVSILNLDGKYYESIEGSQFPEQVHKIVVEDDSIISSFHVCWLYDFSQYMSKHDKNGNFITSNRLPGELDDGISGFGDVCYDNEYYYYASGLALDSGLKIEKYDQDFNFVEEKIIMPDEIVLPEQSFSYRHLNIFKDYIIVSGLLYRDIENYGSAPSLAFWINKNTLELDTVITLEANKSVLNLPEVFLDGEDYITFMTHKSDGSDDNVGVITFDSNKNVVNEWYSDNFYRYLSHYHMAKLKDSSYVYTMHNGNLGNFTRIEKRDKAGSLIWKSRPTQGFLKGSKLAAMTIQKLVAAKNGDILGCGNMYWQNREINFDSLQQIYFKLGVEGHNYIYELYKKCYPISTPYIFRMNTTGNMLWQRAVVMVDSLDQTSPGTFYDIVEEADGSIVYGGRIGTFTSYEAQQEKPHNSNSILLRLNADGCYSNYPCTQWKTYLQPSRILPYFDLRNRWQLYNPQSERTVFARMAETTEIINDREYFILEASDTPDFAKKEVMAYLRVENERMYALETTGERLVFDYFLFPEEEWKSNLILDTSQFVVIGNGYRTKEFIFNDINDRQKTFTWYNGMGSVDDFFFDGHNPSSTLPKWRICKFWINNELKYENVPLSCQTNEVIDLDLISTRVYPNPFTDNIIIENIKDYEKYSIEDLNGRKVIKGNLTEKLKIDASSLPSGVYFLSLSGPNELKNQRAMMIKM
ncbi:MAG: T9SS type A sorting domain-containing protein [Saprospiraceae bacterium]|nr:T9SS type A sorting domain-containing protein [Saprospiraceae bacterium]